MTEEIRTGTSGFVATSNDPPVPPVETTSFAATDETVYFAPDAKEQIAAALQARNRAPRNRAERRALMKKMGKERYNEFMAISETAAKLDYMDLIQKLRELNKKKENEVYDDEQATED